MQTGFVENSICNCENTLVAIYLEVVDVDRIFYSPMVSICCHLSLLVQDLLCFKFHKHPVGLSCLIQKVNPKRIKEGNFAKYPLRH